VQPVVVLLTTGGTLATTFDPVSARSHPTLGPTELLRGGPPGIRVTSRELSNVPSWTLDPAGMREIALAARDAAREPGVTGVVVTHGTTTLEYSAFLTDLVLDAEAPVVFTGAMRRADDPAADGPANLSDALIVAASPEARRLGALVVFAGRILAARQAWKARRLEVDAFVGLNGEVGRILDGRIDALPQPEDQGRARPFSGELDTSVGYVKAVPGMDGRMVDAAAGPETHGLVVEGLPGVGGIPLGMQPHVVAAAARMPVVIASRAPSGQLPKIPTGGTGEPLRDAGLLSAGYLTAEQAWLLLMAALGEGGTPAETRRRFLETALRDT
jgi:L-asparaginase